MNYIVYLLPFFVISLFADVTVTLQVTMNNEQVWALTQDYGDWVASGIVNEVNESGIVTNSYSTNTLTKLEWFKKNATNQIHSAANRRVDIRKQQTQAIITQRWQSLTPEQQTNVINALPFPP